jgi:hypothetical protein
MAIKREATEYTIKVTGPGHSFERAVSEPVASQVISFVMGGGAAPILKSGKGDEQSNNQTPSDKLTPKQFLAKKKPDNNYERVACLAYYLTNYRNTPTFKTKDIDALNTESAHNFRNAPRDVMHATSAYRYLSPAGGGKKQITSLGEAVVDALPDREKVKAVIGEHKPSRKKRVRRKKQAH